jgi:hypothetical protein
MCEIIDFRASDINYYKKVGDHFDFSVEVTDIDDIPISVEDYEDVDFVVGEEVIASLGDGITLLENVINVLKEDNLVEGEYDYSIKITDSDGAIRTIVVGKLIIS